MNLVGALGVVAMFVWLVDVLKLVPLAMDAIAVSRRSAAVIGDATLDDEAKEVALQQSALRLMKLSALLLIGSVVALVAPIGVIWLLERLGVMSLDGVFAVLVRWDFVLFATVAGVGAFVLLQRRKR